jgi:hypothetical protein
MGRAALRKSAMPLALTQPFTDKCAQPHTHRARWSSLTECPLNARLETGVDLSFFLSHAQGGTTLSGSFGQHGGGPGGGGPSRADSLETHSTGSHAQASRFASVPVTEPVGE